MLEYELANSELLLILSATKHTVTQMLFVSLLTVRMMYSTVERHRNNLSHMEKETSSPQHSKLRGNFNEKLPNISVEVDVKTFKNVYLFVAKLTVPIKFE